MKSNCKKCFWFSPDGECGLLTAPIVDGNCPKFIMGLKCAKKSKPQFNESKGSDASELTRLRKRLERLKNLVGSSK